MITNDLELKTALDNLDSVIELVEGVSVQFDREESAITHPCKIVVPQGSQILKVDGSLYCRTDLGVSASMLNGYEESVM